MIEKFLPFQFIKRSPFYGSYQDMNYLITEMKGELMVCYFEGPYAYAHTKEEKKLYRSFSYDEKGYDEALQFLNEVYESKAYIVEN